MNIVLWILQVLLAAAFFAHGWMMLAPPPEIAAQMNAMLPRWFSLFIGVSEVLARNWPHPARTHAYSPLAGDMGGGRNHDRHGVGDRASRRAKRDPPSADHAPAARHGDRRRLREASPPADPGTRRGRVGDPGSRRLRRAGRMAKLCRTTCRLVC